MSNPLNKFILIPELVIEKIITQSMIFLKKDYKDQINEKNSFLWQLTQLVGVQRLVFFDQAKKLFLVEADDPKKINVSLGFPDLVKHAISISIINSGSTHSGDNSLSLDENYSYEDTFAPTQSGGALIDNDSWRQNFGRYYDSTYKIIITSDNYNETLIIFNVLKSIFISLEGTGHFNFLGFVNLKLNDSDIQLVSNQTMKKFQKVIQMNFKYEFRVPGVNKFKKANAILFNGIMKDLKN